MSMLSVDDTETETGRMLPNKAMLSINLCWHIMIELSAMNLFAKMRSADSFHILAANLMRRLDARPIWKSAVYDDRYWRQMAWFTHDIMPMNKRGSCQKVSR